MAHTTRAYMSAIMGEHWQYEQGPQRWEAEEATKALAEASRILADVEPADWHLAGSQQNHRLGGPSVPGSAHHNALLACVASLAAFVNDGGRA